jgi:hypothetical protein
MNRVVQKYQSCLTVVSHKTYMSLYPCNLFQENRDIMNSSYLHL